MHPRSPPNSSWLLSYCLLSAWWRALLGPCRRSRWSFSVHLKVNNSATKTSLAMISDAYESPSHRLSHAVPLVSRFKVKYVPVQIFPPFMKTSKLPVHSTLYNSATRTSLAMILDSYESPTSGLSYAVPYVRRLGKKYISVQFFPPVQFFPLLVHKRLVVGATESEEWRALASRRAHGGGHGGRRARAHAAAAAGQRAGARCQRDQHQVAAHARP